MVKAIMHGCSGKMGQVITGLVAEDQEIEIVAGVDPYPREGAPYPVYESLDACDAEADVIIDFSNAAAVDALLAYSIRRQIPAVVCTTGLSEEQKSHIYAAAEQVGIVYSANMSLGINLLMKLVREAAQVLADAGFDIEIVEKHHNRKVDAPSGTALMLADVINETLDNRDVYVYDRHSVRKKRDKNEIGIHSVRGGTIVGEHEIIFAGRDEIVTLTHTAMSREIFAVGALNAAVFLSGCREARLYAMSDLIQAQ